MAQKKRKKGFLANLFKVAKTVADEMSDGKNNKQPSFKGKRSNMKSPITKPCGGC